MTAPSDTSLTAQAFLADRAARLALAALPNIDLQHLAASLPQFKLTTAGLIHQYGQAAATAALRFYLSARRAAGIGGRPSLPVAAPPGLPQIGQSMDWATSPLYGQSDMVETQRRVTATMERLVLNTGRDTIITASHADQKAKGWARVPETGACAFCALLATRGAVYKEQTVTFRAHDHCRCHAEPVFNVYEPSALIREWQDLYKSTPYGGSAKKARSNFRAAYDAKYAS